MGPICLQIPSSDPLSNNHAYADAGIRDEGAVEGNDVRRIAVVYDL